MIEPTVKPLVDAQGVVKSYQVAGRAVDVLRGVALQIQAGEFLALRGASGAGKSTLLHLLGGLDRADAGTVYFEDVDLMRLSDRDLATVRNRRVGFVFQAYHLLPDLTALENVCFPARMARRPVDETEALARSLLTRVGLGERLSHRPTQLSGGEQQRVAIARSLVNDPPLLLADEPTGNLDSRAGDDIINLLCELQRERGMTLVIATHDDRVAFRAPRTIHLVDGRIAP